MRREIIYKDLCYEIVGICFKIQAALGRFCRERQYCDELEKALINSNKNYKREFLLDKLETNDIKGNRIDFIIDNKVLIDCKAKNFITKENYAQMQRYLRSSDLKLGLVVNFRDTHLKPKRVINYEYDKNYS